MPLESGWYDAIYIKGTDPTGVSTSHVAIQAAIDALPDPGTDGAFDVRGGGTIRLGRGIFRLTTTVNLKANVVIEGEGDATIILVDGNISGIKATSTTAYGMSAWGLRHLRFMCINPGAASTAIETVAFGAASGGHYGVTIEDVRVLQTSGAFPVYGAFAYGFIGDFFIECDVRFLWAQGCTNHGVVLKNASNATAFHNAVIRANPGTGLRVEGVSSPMFFGGTIEGNGTLTNRTVTDGVTTIDTRTVTSATANFQSSDRQGPIGGTNIPSGSFIVSVDSTTQVTISQRATATGSGVSVTIGRCTSIGVEVDDASPNFFATHFEQTGNVPDLRANGGSNGAIYGGEGSNFFIGMTSAAHGWTVSGMLIRANLAFGAGCLNGVVLGGSTAYLARQGAPITLMHTTVNGILMNDVPLREGLQTANYTATDLDVGAVVAMDSASPTTFTIPPGLEVVVGSVIELLQAGAGASTITAGSGVSFLSRGAKLTTAGEGATATLRYRGADEWAVTGDLVA